MIFLGKLLEALPPAPDGCEHHTAVSYSTHDSAVLDRLVADNPGADVRVEGTAVWRDYERGYNVQVSYIENPARAAA